jgi:GntR family transcriptional regulator, transcriptional repressor for pyruvate dehydrogenase complex
MVGAVMEARRLLLSESARLAASRRSPEQAALLASLAEQLVGAPDDEAAQHLDFAWFAVLIEAAGNVVFLLVMNSIRALYLERLDLFRPIVSGREELAPRYRAAAKAIADGDGDAAAAEVLGLAGEQEARLLEALR